MGDHIEELKRDGLYHSLLPHGHIIRFYGIIGCKETGYMLAMEYANKGSLYSYLRRKPSIVGLSYQPIPGDGHCLYHAVALHVGQDQASLRRTVAAHLEANRANFQDFITLSQGQTLTDYIQAVRSGKEWATHIEIEILMRVLNRPIMVIGVDGNLTNPQDATRFTGEPIFVLYNGHNHYDALLLQPEYVARDVLRVNKFRRLSLEESYNNKGSSIFSPGTDDDGNNKDMCNNQKYQLNAEEYQIALDIAHAIKFLHKNGIAHLDIKSGNVLLVTMGRRLRAKISDFGTAQALQGIAHANDKQVGTLLWMPPESRGASPVYSEAGDIYAFGMVLWELLTKQIPYEGCTKKELPPDQPQVTALIKACWNSHKEKRPTATQVVSSLSTFFSPLCKLNPPSELFSDEQNQMNQAGCSIL